MTRYREYLYSKEWQNNHRVWLKKANHRCCILPWLKLGQVKGKYHPYSIHHTNYENLGSEKFGHDVLPVSRFTHRFIIHGVLSGFKRPSEQKIYPNLPQRIAHNWGRLVLNRPAQCLLIGLLASLVWTFNWAYSVAIILFYTGLQVWFD